MRHLAVFAAWENEQALDDFLTNSQLGNTLSAGWHVRLELIRRWGQFSEFDDLQVSDNKAENDQPVVAVTLARLKLPQLFRFIRWGRPVERQVRDHPAAKLALASMRPLGTFSTFSIWRSQREMAEMVHGKGASAENDQHARAMTERERKDFHYQFTTLRFRALAEYGEWLGQSSIVPNLAKNLNS
ncbi:hypothetical protein [Persicirhabdus sediminis]|uniref:Spheroidene monooxygenase n=1 Tax=Persicirhabdus sediminis TaxID=454144 RepID=A0A8J7MKA8_9BACT|nr:hypothetical protein [Persicirhabdus sediminis]MBK1792583.1 hypothetical protein [Persicirhabdus sediminis]